MVSKHHSYSIWHAWNKLSITDKLIWLFFIGNTVGILTLIEILLLQ